MSEWWSKDQEYVTSLGRDILDFLKIAGGVLGVIFAGYFLVLGFIVLGSWLEGQFGQAGVVAIMALGIGLVITIVEFVTQRPARYRRRARK